MSKQYVNKLVKLGVIKLHNKKIKPDEADKAIKEYKDPTRDAQRDANSKTRSDDDLFADKNVPEDSLATMSDEERKKYNDDMAYKYSKLEEMSSEEENNSRPKHDSSSSEWNTFKIKQQGLNYEIDRKVKERNLMSLSDFKAAAEIIISPINYGLDNLAFELKAKFPQISDEAIQWIIERTNQIKVDVQNVSV